MSQSSLCLSGEGGMTRIALWFGLKLQCWFLSVCSNPYFGSLHFTSNTCVGATLDMAIGTWSFRFYIENIQDFQSWLVLTRWPMLGAPYQGFNTRMRAHLRFRSHWHGIVWIRWLRNGLRPSRRDKVHIFDCHLYLCFRNDQRQIRL